MWKSPDATHFGGQLLRSLLLRTPATSQKLLQVHMPLLCLTIEHLLVFIFANSGHKAA